MSIPKRCELCGEIAVKEVQIVPPKIGRRGARVEVIEQAVTVWACSHHALAIWKAPSAHALRARQGAWSRFWSRRQDRLI